MKKTFNELSALLTLLQDEDLNIASLAMEQFLMIGHDADETIAENQESHDPCMRKRIHQLSSILRRRDERERFIAGVNSGDISLWQGVILINKLYDPGVDDKSLERAVHRLLGKLDDDSTTHIAAFMREQMFTVPPDDILDVNLFFIQRVLESKYGSPALLCVIAKQFADILGGNKLTIVLHSGRFCLIDKYNMLLDPSEGWRISKMPVENRIHPCGRKDVLLNILSQLFLVALLDGQMRDIHHFSDLLTALNGDSLDSLPFPLGDNK